VRSALPAATPAVRQHALPGGDDVGAQEHDVGRRHDDHVERLAQLADVRQVGDRPELEVGALETAARALDQPLLAVDADHARGAVAHEVVAGSARPAPDLQHFSPGPEWFQVGVKGQTAVPGFIRGVPVRHSAADYNRGAASTRNGIAAAES
jgi:hypothetical protein